MFIFNVSFPRHLQMEFPIKLKTVKKQIIIGKTRDKHSNKLGYHLLPNIFKDELVAKFWYYINYKFLIMDKCYWLENTEYEKQNIW